MTVTEFVRRCPRLYHMAEEGTWGSIARHGLLSTSALLDLFEIHGQRRRAIETRRRPEIVTLVHPVHGHALVRDNKPISDEALRKCLIDMSPKAWYRLLNGKVFFWVTWERLDRLLGARAYRRRRHCVITVDTAALVARDLDRIALSPINSGCTLFKPPMRAMSLCRSSTLEVDALRKRSGSAGARRLRVSRSVMWLEARRSGEATGDGRPHGSARTRR